MLGCLVVVSAVARKPLNDLFMLRFRTSFRRHFGDEGSVTRQSLSNNRVVRNSLSPTDHGLSLIKSKYQLVKYIIVKFTQLCSKFPPTALFNFACDWLAFNRDISFGRLTDPNV